MPLQADDLVMIALGVDRDAPPLVEPPPLKDGIHLRWAFRRDRGFPWYGYFLYRRPSEKAPPRCLAPRWGDHPIGPVGSASISTPDGTISSDAPLVLTDDFPDAARPEIDMCGRLALRVDLPAGEAGYQIAATLGFRQPPLVQHCIDFRKQTPGGLKNPFDMQKVRFEARGPNDEATAGARLIKVRDVGLDIPASIVVTLPQPVFAAELWLATTGDAPLVEALDAQGRVVADVLARPDASGLAHVELPSKRPIVRVRVKVTPGQVVLERICWRVPVKVQPAITMRAFDGSTEVAAVTLQGAAGTV